MMNFEDIKKEKACGLDKLNMIERYALDQYINNKAINLAKKNLIRCQITLLATVFLKLYDEFSFGNVRITRLANAIDNMIDGYANESNAGEVITMQDICDQLKADTGYDILDKFNMSDEFVEIK